MNMGLKEFLRNDSVDVRSSAAGNPNTSGAVLAELAKDSIRMRILSALDEKFKEVFGR